MSSTIPRAASSDTSAGSSIDRTPCAIRVIGSSSAARTLSGPRPLAGVDRAAEAGVGGDREHLGEVVRREARLVAGHREADHVGVGPLGGVARDPQRLLDSEVANGRDQDPALDAGVAPGLVDPPRDPLQVLLVAQPDGRGMVGRGGELDVDRAAASALRTGTRR